MQTTENADGEFYAFKVTGEFEVASHLKPVFGRQNTIIGFELPDGRMARLIVGLELETKVNPEIQDYAYITSQQEMDQWGFGCLNYSMTSFEKND
jgi:hypothetical protein